MSHFLSLVYVANFPLPSDTTIAELIKTITDKTYFLEQIYTEQSQCVVLYKTTVTFSTVCTALREEEATDKPNEYIESNMGMSQPVEKVNDHISSFG